MIDVEVIVNIVEVRSHELVLYRVVPCRNRGERRLASALLANKRLQPLEEPRFNFRQENHEGGGVAPFGRRAVRREQRIGNRGGNG